MLKNQDGTYIAGTMKQVLVADDEMINREILREMLQGSFEVLFAEDGEETLSVIRAHKDTLSMVILDIRMPGISGLEVLKIMKEDGKIARIPVIVATSERETEVESLKMGAVDFIPKPYPDADVVLARVQRIIELSEDRDLIRQTERDALTGLYNREYFYRYAAQFDQFSRGTETDAVILDVNHFHLINERYGKAYGDEVLIRIGRMLLALTEESPAIACRREADTFMIYCPHREDYQELLDRAAADFTEDDGSGAHRVRLYMGVYSRADRSIDMELRFDRAKMAADTVKGSFTANIGYYDDNMHERQLYAEQLIEDFPEAIARGQFRVYYQPKFDVRLDVPVLASAEALVRWNHPKLGMVSPGVFIPLFEENGLIERLDTYVWRETARQIRDWKDRLGYSVPVSVNVSRIDLYDPRMPGVLSDIVEESRLTSEDLLLEVTESAYSKDSERIIAAVESLRSKGFRIEMDDFGTGYSSLNMITAMPIDALKLDMQFIRGAFAEGGSTHMLEVMISIADFLRVPVIAEGVETEEQLRSLKALGCDLVQGYFFSKPVPAGDFEAFILQRKEANAFAAERIMSPGPEKAQDVEQLMRGIREESGGEQAAPPAGISSGADVLPGEQEKPGLHLRTASIFFIIIAVLAAAALLSVDMAVTHGYQRMETASDRYIQAQLAASEMESASDYLTDRVRCFVMTGETEYLEDFFEEVEVSRRRDRAVESLETLLDGGDGSALQSLNTALALSNELITVENRAMRLMLETGDYSPEEVPDALSSTALDAADEQLTPEEKALLARSLVFDRNYMNYKERIRENVEQCTEALLRASGRELDQAGARLSLLMEIQTFLTVLFLLIVLGIVLVITALIRIPLTRLVRKMQEQESVRPTGAEELRFVTRTYNKILRENRAANERLSHEASHDALTGLFNRGAYDLLLESADKEHMALILIDVDDFKGVNDTYGHAVGDKVLKRVAEVLKRNFRSVDILCRIGGDEFAVVMTRVNSSLRQLVLNKVHLINDALKHPKDDLPPVSISVGVAFSDRDNPGGDIFRDADAALYRTKAAGRNGCTIY